MVDQENKCCSYAGRTYKITDYSDDMFDTCPSCDDKEDEGLTPWDGKLYNFSGDGCLWLPESPPALVINKSLMGFVNLIRLTEVPQNVDTSAGDSLIGGTNRAPSAECVFVLSIKCLECSVYEHDMWVGHNPDPVPEGIYRYVRGCHTSRNTVSVEVDEA